MSIIHTPDGRALPMRAPDPRIEALAHDPDVGPLWPAIIERGQLEASPGQVAAFAEACSVHGLDGLDTQEIVGLLRAHGRPKV